MNSESEYKKDLFEDLKYSLNKFDSQSLAISSGALGLSLTFIKDIVPFQDSENIILFYAGLISFIITLISGFISHYFSSKQIEDAIKKCDEGKMDEIKDSGFISRLNLITMLSLLFGIICIVLYCILNIENSRDKKKVKDIPKEILIKKDNIEISGKLKEIKYIDTLNNNLIKIK